MEKEGLDELMEAEKKKEEQFNNDNDDDDIQSCIDIRDFERRLKSQRSTRNKMSGGMDSSSDDNDDDYFANMSQHSRSFMSSKSNNNMMSKNNSLNTTAQLLNQSRNSIQSKIQKIKQNDANLKANKQMQSQQSQMQQQSIQSQQAGLNKKNLKKYDDPELEAIMKSPNLEQKVKELMNKYSQLQKNFDRERNMRMKYENEHVSVNKTRLEETTSNGGMYQSSKIPKGSVLSAINSNEELITLKQEVQKLQKDLLKKDKMVQELITDKATGSTSSSSNGFKTFEDSKIKRLENEIKIMKKERDEFFASRFDKKNAELVKDLSFQNSKLRIKIEELEAITKKK